MYTKDQMRQFGDWLASRKDVVTGSQIDEYIAGIAKVPSVDVVESQKALMFKVGKIIYDHVHKSSDPYAPTLDFKCKQSAQKIIPIIEAEVERRVRERDTAPATPVKHDPDDGPEPGMEGR